MQSSDTTTPPKTGGIRIKPRSRSPALSDYSARNQTGINLLVKCFLHDKLLTVMGRGLSKLQREILKLALSYRSRGLNYLCQPYILKELHGWNYTDAIGQYFSRSEIGKQRYNVARASMSRAIRRLEKRGLVTSFPKIELTAEGVRIASRISPEKRKQKKPKKI